LRITMKTSTIALISSSVLGLVAGCGSVVIGGNDDATGGSGTGGAGGASVGGGQASLAIALFEDELPIYDGGESSSVAVGAGGAMTVGTGVGGYGSGGANPTGGGTTVGTSVGAGGAQTSVASSTVGSGGGGPVPNPDNLHVFIGSEAQLCADPFAGPECPPGGFKISFQLSPDQQELGVYSLQDLNGFTEQSGFDGQGCWFGGGSFWDGTVEVIDINASTLTVRLDGTSSFEPGVDLDGTYVVDRCGQGTSNESALAMFRYQIPGSSTTSGSGSAQSVTVGTSGGPEGDDLMLFVNSSGGSCGDPIHTECGDDSWSVTVGLPAAYQALGTYSLSDPALQSTFSVTFNDADPEACSGGGGSYFGGEIEVLSLDSSTVTFRLTNTDSLFGSGNADGTYTAPRCF
jgi:hypothetical protein